MSQRRPKPHINIIYAGGTFGCYGTPLTPLDADVFLPVLSSQIEQHKAMFFNLSATQCCRSSADIDIPIDDTIDATTDINFIENQLIKDSSQLTSTDFFYFYQLILKHYAQGEKCFVLITGTDTLSYLGAFLAESFAGSDVCILLTASMKPLLDSTLVDNFQIDADSDAWDNLKLAIQTTQRQCLGVYVCLQDEVWHATMVQKINSQQMQAFTGNKIAHYPATSYHPLSASAVNSWLDDRKQRLPSMKSRLQGLDIITLFVTPNEETYLPSILSSILQRSKRATGVILLSLGSGNVPFTKDLAEVFDSACQAGHLIVNTSQCPFGGVNSDYLAGSWQYQHQVLSAEYLTTEACFARLLWLHLAYDTPSLRRERWQQWLNLSEYQQIKTPQNNEPEPEPEPEPDRE